MDTPKKLDTPDILTEVAEQLHILGSANDAEDRNFKAEAERMRSQASIALQALLEDYPVLARILPDLASELETSHIYGFGWSTLLDEIENYRLPK